MTLGRRLLVGLIGAALVTIPLACGDDDNGGAGGGDDATDADAVVDSSDDSETLATDSGTGAGPTGGDLARWCALTAELNQIEVAGEDESASPDEVEATFNAMNELAEQYLEASPDQIGADAELVVGAFRAAQDLLASHDYDINAVAEDPAFEDVFNDDVQAAGDRIDEFEEANC